MKRQKGFSLMEMMIVIAIIGIITAIAIPTYLNHVTATRRTEGTAALTRLSAALERYYAENNTYATATIGTGTAATDVLDTNTTTEGWYQLSFSAQTATAYTIRAIPQNGQATDDTECATLTLDSLGVRGITGTGTVATCW